MKIRPQEGPQEMFLGSSADIVVYGGAAGGGKSFGLLMEPLRHINVPRFGAVIFRRQGVEIRKEGGLWDESSELYPLTGATSRESMLDWKWPAGARVSFSHLEQENDKYTWQGAQIAFIGFDELTHFTKSQFFYMLSRNRTTCGVRPYIRATCNADADSWVADMIAWWIDQETGYPIPERSGVIRYFIRRGEELIWADSPAQLVAEHDDVDLKEVKSFTFIAARVEDNKILLEKDPGYLGNLKALTMVERERLLRGNWKIKPAAGLYFKRRYFEIIDALPADVVGRVRHWDLAATEPEPGQEPDWTVGLRMVQLESGLFVVENVERLQGSPLKVKTAIKNTASADGTGTIISLPQDPGQAGKSQAQDLVTMLRGYTTVIERETGSKIVRASPASSQAEVGNIKLLRAPWNEAFLTELENFPGKGKDDQVDALSGAFNTLQKPRAKFDVM